MELASSFASKSESVAPKLLKLCRRYLWTCVWAKHRLRSGKNGFKMFVDLLTVTPSSGQLTTNATPSNMERVRHAAVEVRHLRVPEEESNLGIMKCIIWEILTRNLGMTLVCAIVSPKFVFEKIICGDELWIYGFDPKSKQECSHRKLPSESGPKKACQGRSNIKSMLILFFYFQDVMHYEYTPRGPTTNRK